MVIHVAMVQEDKTVEIEMVSMVWYAKRNCTGSAAVLARTGPKVHKEQLKRSP